jgi:hypothetical protein
VTPNFPQAVDRSYWIIDHDTADLAPPPGSVRYDFVREQLRRSSARPPRHLRSSREFCGRFIFPRHIEGETVTIRDEQLEELLDGFDLWRQGHRELR